MAVFRTTLRLDPSKPDEKQALDLLRALHDEKHASYTELIIPAVNDYYGHPKESRPFTMEQTAQIRAIVREEMLNPLLLGQLPPFSGQSPVQENIEPDDDELDEILDNFGS